MQCILYAAIQQLYFLELARKRMQNDNPCAYFDKQPKSGVTHSHRGAPTSLSKIIFNKNRKIVSSGYRKQAKVNKKYGLLFTFQNCTSSSLVVTKS